MRTLTESDVIAMFREEWDRKLAEAMSAVFKTDGGTQAATALSPELKLRHKKSRYKYTIDAVSAREAVLRTPEGKKFSVDKETLENEYELA